MKSISFGGESEIEIRKISKQNVNKPGKKYFKENIFFSVFAS